MFNHIDWYNDAVEIENKEFRMYRDFFSSIDDLEHWIETKRPRK